MDEATSQKQAWVLTEEALEKLLARLDSDRERAGEIYETIRRKLTKFFECWGCPFPEEYTDKTMDRVARKISEGEEIRASNPYVYFHGVARNVFREYLREREKQRVEADLEAWPAPHASGSVEPERRTECLSRCMERLSSEDSELVMQYYQGECGAKIENRKRLAEQWQINLNTLRIRLYRLRGKLEGCVRDCLESRAKR